MTIIGFGFSVWAAVFVAAVMLSPVAVAAGIALWGRAQRHAEHRRLLVDADYQHSALMRGNLVGGTFGRYPPTLIDTRRGPTCLS